MVAAGGRSCRGAFLARIFDLVRRSSVKSDSNFVAADEGKTARQMAMSSLALSCLNVRHLVRYFSRSTYRYFVNKNPCHPPLPRLILKSEGIRGFKG